jgi:hypothetical protein
VGKGKIVSTSAPQGGSNIPGGSVPSGARITGQALIATGFVLMALLGLVDLWIASDEMGVAPLLVGMALATLPVPIYVALVLWVDRYEKEPIWVPGSSRGGGGNVLGNGVCIGRRGERSGTHPAPNSCGPARVRRNSRLILGRGILRTTMLRCVEGYQLWDGSEAVSLVLQSLNDLRDGCYGAGAVGFGEGVGVLAVVQESDTTGACPP